MVRPPDQAVVFWINPWSSLPPLRWLWHRPATGVIQTPQCQAGRHVMRRPVIVSVAVIRRPGGGQLGPILDHVGALKRLLIALVTGLAGGLGRILMHRPQALFGILIPERHKIVVVQLENHLDPQAFGGPLRRHLRAIIERPAVVTE